MNYRKVNYQKELEKLLTRLEKEERVPTLYCIVAAHRAVVMY